MTVVLGLALYGCLGVNASTRTIQVIEGFVCVAHLSNLLNDGLLVGETGFGPLLHFGVGWWSG